MNKLPAILLLALLALAACGKVQDTDLGSTGPSESAAPGPVHLDAAGAAKLLGENEALTVLDVRTPEEFGDERITGAVNLDYRDPAFRDNAAKLDKDKPYLLHCRSGGRSSAALTILEDLGFKNLYHLDGGLSGWIDAGLPVEE